MSMRLVMLIVLALVVYASARRARVMPKFQGLED